jgi:hypothetical protein
MCGSESPGIDQTPEELDLGCCEVLRSEIKIKIVNAVEVTLIYIPVKWAVR